MKKILKTAGWQIGAFVLAIGAAFATNAMKDTTFFTTEIGHQPMNSGPVNCKPRIECSTVFGPICQWKEGLITHNLYKKVEVSTDVFQCALPLYKAN